jgi:hypothetical protein
VIIQTYKNYHDQSRIVELLLKKQKDAEVESVQRVYYPFGLFVYDIKMRNPKSALNRQMMVVIDLMNGRGAIGDSDPELTEIEVDDIDVIPQELTGEEISAKAHDYMIKEMLKKLRVLYLPEITEHSYTLFHKMYYVIRMRHKKTGERFAVMADSIEGRLGMLDV